MYYDILQVKWIKSNQVWHRIILRFIFQIGSIWNIKVFFESLLILFFFSYTWSRIRRYKRWSQKISCWNCPQWKTQWSSKTYSNWGQCTAKGPQPIFPTPPFVPLWPSQTPRLQCYFLEKSKSASARIRCGNEKFDGTIWGIWWESSESSK